MMRREIISRVKIYSREEKERIVVQKFDQF